MAITAQEVNKLRQMTGAGMMDCKKALVEADGDFDKAIEILRKKGQKVSEKRADRTTSEGTVLIKTNDDSTLAVLIGLGCETDFVAKNDEFQSLASAILEVAYSSKPATVEELKALQIDGVSINDKLVELVGKIGEKIDVVAYEILEGEKVVPYIHSNNKLGVLVSLSKTNGVDVVGAGKDIAMQIAAMSPIAVDKSGVSQDIIERELAIGREQAVNEGKPENIVDKIAEGKLNKYFKDNTLLEQPFVKDSAISVAKYLDSVSKGLTVSAFKRISIG